MSMQSLASARRNAFGVFAAVAACLLMPAAFAAAPAGNVSLKGAVVRGDKATPVTGARVYAVHLDTKQVFTSAPSAEKGDYQLTGLPYGYYDIAVETSDGLFLANRVINAPAGEKIEVSLVLGPPQPEDTEWWSAEPDRRIPGLDRTPDGVARIVEGRPRAGAMVVAKAKGAAVGAGAGAGTGGAGYLAPVLAAVGIAALGALVNHQKDSSSELPATPFLPGGNTKKRR